MGRWMGSKHNPGELFTYARTPIRWQPPERLTAAASRGCKPQTNTSEKPQFSSSLSALHLTWKLRLTHPFGYPLEVIGIKDQVLPQPFNIQTVSTCYGYQACFQISHYYTRLYWGGVGSGEVRKSILECCKMLIHNTTLEAQELQLPNATFLPPSLQSLSTAPAKARAQPTGRPPCTGGCSLNSSWSGDGAGKPHTQSAASENCPDLPPHASRGRSVWVGNLRPRGLGRHNVPSSPKSALSLSPLSLFFWHITGKPGRPEMSGPRGVRRRDKGEREAVGFFFGGAGGNLSRAEVR